MPEPMLSRRPYALSRSKAKRGFTSKKCICDVIDIWISELFITEIVTESDSGSAPIFDKRTTSPGIFVSFDSKFITTNLRPSENTASTAMPESNGPTPGSNSSSRIALLPSSNATFRRAPIR
jgi:hypothetical protein